MGRWIWWPARLGLLGLCLIWAGCGDSDIPDPESDSHAATESTTLPVASDPAPAPAEEKSAKPAAWPAEAVAKAEPAPAESPRRWPKLEETATKETQVALAEKTTKPAETRPAGTASASPGDSRHDRCPRGRNGRRLDEQFPGRVELGQPDPEP